MFLQMFFFYFKQTVCFPYFIFVSLFMLISFTTFYKELHFSVVKVNTVIEEQYIQLCFQLTVVLYKQHFLIALIKFIILRNFN